MARISQRRAKGDNSITRLANGKLRVRVDCGFINGKRKQLSATCETLKEAQAKAKELEKQKAELLARQKANLDGESFDALAERYNNQASIVENTHYAYEHYRQQVRDFFRFIPLSDINTSDINRLINYLKQKGLSDSSVKTYLSWLSSVFNWAVEELEILPKNPVRKANIPKTKPLKNRMDIMSKEEQEAVLGLCLADYEYHKATGETPKHVGQGKRPGRSHLYNIFYVFLCLAIETGMREGEIAGLKWSNVDLDKKELYVSSQIQYMLETKGLSDVKPKTESSIRAIILSSFLSSLLSEYKEASRAHFGFLPEYLWTSQNGGKNWPYRLLETFQTYCREAGIQRRLTFHMLRHTSATLTLEASDNNFKLLQERLGHSSINTSLSYYLHLVKRQHETTVENLSKTLESVKKPDGD